MTRYGWNYENMMDGFAFFGGLVWIVVLVDLALLGIWLWQQIQKK